MVIGVCWGGFVGVCMFGGRVLESCSWLEFRWALLLRLWSVCVGGGGVFYCIASLNAKKHYM